MTEGGASASIEGENLGTILNLADGRAKGSRGAQLELLQAGPDQVLAVLAPCRFSDPGRFSLAHGGKDGHPFPVPLRVYDQTLDVLRRAVDAAKLGNDDRLSAVRELDRQARALERTATSPSFDEHVARERAASTGFGGGRCEGVNL